MSMRRANSVLAVVSVLLVLTNALHAAPTGPADAEMAVTGWLLANPRPLNATLGHQVVEVEIIRGQDDRPICYAVRMRPSGFVVVAADDLVEPIIAFSPEGALDGAPANPLRALVAMDLAGRIAASRSALRRPVLQSTSARSSTQKKWDLLRGLGRNRQGRISLMALTAVADVRVAPLVQSKWGQSVILSDDQTYFLACYNYYTPQIVPGGALSWDSGDTYYGDPDNYPTGCVATALAQLMRCYEHPKARPIQPDPTDPNNVVGVGRIETDGTFVPLVPDLYRSLLGGDGSGGPYPWKQMAPEPDGATAPDQIRAIGALCHDAGVAARMQYASDESRTSLLQAKRALVTNFTYENAVCASSYGANIGPALATMINSNLDAKRPVILAIDGPDGGHAVVVDGYGYESTTPYHHMNMGWQGSDDVWYNLPIIECQEQGYLFTVLSACLYNVYDTGHGEIISGRVLRDDGGPAAGAVVYSLAEGGADPCQAITDNKGIYFFEKLESQTTYTVWASVDGSDFPARQVTTGRSQDLVSSTGNKWAVDFPQAYRVLRVDPRAVGGTNDGSSWANAFVDLQDALDEASNSPDKVTEIWVARGRYKPDRATGQRNLSFRLMNRVGLYGGFAGGESDREQRDPVANETILTGDLSGNDGSGFANNNENSHHVVDAGGTDATAVIDGFTITGGNADGSGWDAYGAGILVADGGPAISNCRIVANRAVEYGGGIHNQTGNPTLTDCIFSDNSAQYGGGMLNISGTAVLSTCQFNANTATENGGGIYSQGSDLTATYCKFTANSAKAGGGINNQGGNPKINTCEFSENLANYGAGMANVGVSEISVSTCQFTANVAAEYGGGIYSQSSGGKVSGCTFSENSAGFGGGLFGQMGSDAALASCKFIGNIATGDGGGMFNSDSSPKLTGCVFRQNSGRSGAGMFNQSGGNAILSSCEFVTNVAGSYGGGMYNLTSNPRLTNCTFSRNEAQFGGGALNDNYSAPEFTNCNLISNEAKPSGSGGGLYNHDNSVAVLTNCIVWYNAYGQLTGGNGGDFTVTYSDVEGGISGKTNISLEPLFADPDNGDYHLISRAGRWDPKAHTWVIDHITSPCIDAGDPSTPVGEEPKGENGGIINMGAHGGTNEASKTPVN